MQRGYKGNLRKARNHRAIFTREMDTENRYFTYSLIPNIGATDVVLGEDVAVVLELFNSVYTVKAVLVDNTSTNIGCEAGLVTNLEKKN